MRSPATYITGVLWFYLSFLTTAAANPAAVRLTDSLSTGKPGIKSIDIHTDNGLLNRLNAHRRAELLFEYPDQFGVSAEFPPLLTIHCEGPGTLTVTCTPSGGITVLPIKKGTIAEIWPKYDIRTLTDVVPLQEQVEVKWETPEGKTEKVSKEISWSGPQEVFLSEKRITDLVVLALKEKTGWNNKTEALNELEKTRRRGITYAEPKNKKGWQKVRSSNEMWTEKKANCLDLTIWVAGKALRTGWQSKIVILGDHSMPIFGDPSAPVKLETTALVGTPTRKRVGSLAEAAKIGEMEYAKVAQEPEKETWEVSLNAWAKMYATDDKPLTP